MKKKRRRKKEEIKKFSTLKLKLHIFKQRKIKIKWEGIFDMQFKNIVIRSQVRCVV